MERWRRLGSERLQRCRVFDLDRVRFQPPDGREPRDFYVVLAPDWINVIPLTDARRVVLIRQFRFGVDDFTLEIPGGMCEEGEPAADSARREMLEETGYRARDLVPLGWVHPNPAVQTNRCYSFLATGAYPAGHPTPDPDEEFEVLEVPLDDVPRMIGEGAVRHSLVIAAFHLLAVHKLP